MRRLCSGSRDSIKPPAGECPSQLGFADTRESGDDYQCRGVIVHQASLNRLLIRCARQRINNGFDLQIF